MISNKKHIKKGTGLKPQIPFYGSIEKFGDKQQGKWRRGERKQ